MSHGGIARFTVDRWYKGAPTSDVQISFAFSRIWGVPNGHDCIDFQPDTSWIIFAVRQDGLLKLSDDCYSALPISPRFETKLPDTADLLHRMAADFASGLQDNDANSRIVSLQRLGNLKSRAILAILNPFIEASSGKEYEWAVYAALRTGDSTVLSKVSEILKKSNPRNLPASLMPSEISSIADPAAVPGLLDLLNNSSSARLQALRALSQIRDPRAIPAIAPYLSNSDVYVRYQALDAMRKLTHSNACNIVPGDVPPLEQEEQQCLDWWRQTQQ